MFHQIKLTVSYNGICYIFTTNAKVIEKKMGKKVWTARQFFILYDNMNIYEHVHNTYIFNQVE